MSDVTGDMDVASYSYPTAGKPHRLASATIDGISNTFSYDAAGNITQYDAATGDDTFFAYDVGGRVKKITVGDSLLDTTPTARDTFWYGPDGQRYLRKARWDDNGTLKTSWTLYLLGGTFEEVHPEHDSAIDYRQRVLVTANVQHQFVKPVSGAGSSHIDYLHRDHLGNIVAGTDESGALVNSTAFDPFGRQRGVLWGRDASGTEMDDLAEAEDTFTARGYTDHEMLNRTGFVHMNGRVYDARIGRFIQADPIVGNPANGQNYNRYAYVFNSPLSYTDPSGFDCADDDQGCGNATFNGTGHSETARGFGWDFVGGNFGFHKNVVGKSGPGSVDNGGPIDQLILELLSRSDVLWTGSEFIMKPPLGFDDMSVTHSGFVDACIWTSCSSVVYGEYQLVVFSADSDSAAPSQSSILAKLISDAPYLTNSDLYSLGRDSGSGVNLGDPKQFGKGVMNQIKTDLKSVDDVVETPAHVVGVYIPTAAIAVAALVPAVSAVGPSAGRAFSQSLRAAKTLNAQSAATTGASIANVAARTAGWQAEQIAMIGLEIQMQRFSYLEAYRQSHYYLISQPVITNILTK